MASEVQAMLTQGTGVASSPRTIIRHTPVGDAGDAPVAQTRAELAAGRSVIHLAPTAAVAADRRRRLLADPPRPAWEDIPPVYTFAELTRRIVAETTFSRPAAERLRPALPDPETPQLRVTLVAEIIRQGRLAGKIRRLHPNESPAVAKLIEEIIQAQCEPKAFADIVAGRSIKRDPSAAGGEAHLESELSAVYTAYRAALNAAGWNDPDTLTEAALRMLEGEYCGVPCRWPFLLRRPILIVDHFTDFTALQWRLLHILSAAARRSEWFFPAAPSPKAQVPVELACRMLQKLVGDNVIETDAPRGAAPPPLLNFAVAVCGDSPPGPPATANVTVRVHPTPEAEAAAALSDIRAALHAGVAPSEIAVVARRRDVYAQLLRRLAPEYGVPVALLGGGEQPASDTNYARRVLAALKALSRQPSLLTGELWRAARDLAAVRRRATPNLEHTGEEDADAAADAAVRELAAEHLPWTRWPPALRPDAIRIVPNSWRRPVEQNGVARVTELAAELHSVGEPLTRSEVAPETAAEAVAGIVAHYRLRDRAAAGLRAAAAAASDDDLRAALADLHGVEQLLRACATAVRLHHAAARVMRTPATIIRPKDFIAILADILRRPVVAEPLTNRDAVPLLEPTQTRGLKFTRLFLLGCAEGWFPTPPPYDPYYPPESRTELKVDGLVLADHDPLRHLGGERHFFLLAATAAEYLTISRPQTDLDGRPLGASPFFSAAAELAPPATRQPEPGIDEAPAKTDAPTPRARLYAWASGCGRRRVAAPETATGANGPEPLWAAQRWGTTFLADLQRGCRVADARETNAPSPYNGFIPYAATPHRDPERIWSYAEITAYQRCPYYFFARDVLRLRRRSDEAGRCDWSQWERERLARAVLGAYLTLPSLRACSPQAALERAAGVIFRADWKRRRPPNPDHRRLAAIPYRLVLRRLRRFIEQHRLPPGRAGRRTFAPTILHIPEAAARIAVRPPELWVMTDEENTAAPDADLWLAVYWGDAGRCRTAAVRNEIGYACDVFAAYGQPTRIQLQLFGDEPPNNTETLVAEAHAAWRRRVGETIAGVRGGDFRPRPEEARSCLHCPAAKTCSQAVVKPS